jgi:hypothetical protein
MRSSRIVLVAGLSAGLLAGCGSGDEKSSSDEPATSAGRAITEIGVVRNGLDEALTTYRSGDGQAADKLVGDAYLEHFELVEGPLEAKDEELTEKLEDAIREELRDKIQAGAPKQEIAALVAEIKADLKKAEAALR